MEDDEEIHSHPSPASGSPETPRQNGRITVTVASAPPQNTLTLALPIQQQQPQQQNTRTGGTGSGGGGGREDCWSEGATSVLIDAWGERYLELSRGNLKQKHWKEVADIVSSREDYTKAPKTDIQCKNRIDTVKKKYKLEKSKIASGNGPSKWPFFDRLDQLIGPTAKITSGSGAGPSSVTPALPSGSHRAVPIGIPVGIRSAPAQFNKQQQKQKQILRRRPPVDSDSSQSEPARSPDSTDSFPPETFERKRPRIQPRELNLGADRQGGGVKENNWGNSVRELTRAILKFGEAYEQAESSKLQQLVEMEKQRMKFAKELELQRMKFFMNTQLELSQLKNRRVGNINHHMNNNNNNDNNNNNNNSESTKRQRRWNSEGQNLNISTTTTNAAAMPKRNFSRSDSMASKEPHKERVVPPSSKPSTTSLRIDRFLRPFTLKAVQELLGKTGSVTSFWMDNIKTHCYVTYSSVEEAEETRNAVYNLQWPPNGGRLLVAEFVDPQEVKTRVEAPPPSPATPATAAPPLRPPPPPPPPAAAVPSPRLPMQRQQLPPPPSLPPPPPPPQLSLPPPPPLPERVEPPIVTLDDLFRKTKATPRIYYLPLSDEQVEHKAKMAQGKIGTAN